MWSIPELAMLRRLTDDVASRSAGDGNVGKYTARKGRLGLESVYTVVPFKFVANVGVLRYPAGGRF
jgi:hypothetical protein